MWHICSIRRQGTWRSDSDCLLIVLKDASCLLCKCASLRMGAMSGGPVGGGAPVPSTGVRLG